MTETKSIQIVDFHGKLYIVIVTGGEIDSGDYAMHGVEMVYCQEVMDDVASVGSGMAIPVNPYLTKIGAIYPKLSDVPTINKEFIKEWAYDPKHTILVEYDEKIIGEEFASRAPHINNNNEVNCSIITKR